MIRHLSSLALAVSSVLAGAGAAWAGSVSVMDPPDGSIAGTVQTFTDIDLWRAAASGVGTGVVHEIDFETLPDGSPSFSGALITTGFNYTAQGVTFFPHVLTLEIVGNDISGFGLSAGYNSGEPRNWIIAELTTPALAIGVEFPGSTNISIYDVNGDLIESADFGSSGNNLFGGFETNTPIGSVVIDRGSLIEAINAFAFSPVPEPATLLLMWAGACCLFRRKK